ncbi:PepSY-like domain-containing protein [Hymenobacter properus]|uniref:PepSY-like domain-containing protein n=1 Tax=Hymenobacter properus TaxID=2791026 RepID=A0A931FMZ2_9BACT|nr:PepSY-like domain-containing protein [Hymenobacter properus]MBF9144540.1 PepSY-like domain-containing protein [Hymenobacter properus]MBR7723358.1 PepSY-like domain-containing protein [Microvirga sp. SRT04]
MKTVLMFAVATLLAGSAHAQKVAAAQVPAAAKATFQAKFPAVKTVAWEKEGTDYEAGFKQNGKTMSAVITPAGVLQETETDMKVAELPAAVRATLARDYKAYQVKEAATIVKADGRTVYEAEVSKGGKEQDVLFTADGKVVTQ